MLNGDGASSEACHPIHEDDDCEAFSDLASVGHPIEDDAIYPDATEEGWMLLGDGADCMQPGMHAAFSMQEQEALLHAELQAQRHEHLMEMHTMETYMHTLGMTSPEPHVVWCESGAMGVDPGLMAYEEAEYCGGALGAHSGGQNEIQPLKPGVMQRTGCTEIELMEEED